MDNTPSTLAYYRDVECPSAARDEALGAMIFGMLFYCIGFFVLNAYLAVIAPSKWNDLQFRKFTRFLVNRWRPEYWWWGVEVLARNVLVACSGLLSSDPRVALLCLSILVVAHSTVVAIYGPWIRAGLNTFEIVATLLLGMIGLFGLIFHSVHNEKAILVQFEEDWVQDAVQEREDSLHVYAICSIVVLGLFFALFFGLVVWCLSAMCPGVVQAEVRANTERGNRLLTRFTEATKRSDFSLLITAVITRGTEYERTRLEELLQKLACVRFTKQGDLETAYIMPPHKDAALTPDAESKSMPQTVHA